ncbi:hypothetical protein PVAND_011811 [Polypedilum vanderplanki]|uniref:Uncharacterized protein n=1 Tax=Polypedilum vanderplanki TaxID=319348 RepID=A0A9J6CKF3_POLVA|nr:hypothetical protein PVAND_011811 [Polypedilum vanderplanki]
MIEKSLIYIILIFITVSDGADKSDSLYFVASNRGLDYKIAGKKDAHRFGVELKENKQFHHTITAEDGVRLGCYGYELDGMKYSTNYIADGKGYRLAPNQDLITVYAKGSSEPRIASFKESFTAEEIEKANIRYFFPEGCEAPKIFHDPNNPSQAFEERRKLFDSLVQKAQAEKLKNLNTRSNDDSKRINSKNSSTLLSNNINGLNSRRNNNNNGSNNSTILNANNNLTRNPGEISDILSHSHPGSGFNRKGKSAFGGIDDYDNNNNNECCSTGIKIELPSNILTSTCSGNMAKIIIPINSEKLSSVSMKEIIEISKQTSSTSSMLTELQKLAAKYEL